MQCRAPGCHGAAHGYSPFCQNHKQALRRHGAPTQEGVTVHELRPYVALVEARKAKNPDSEAWTILMARWGVVQDHARATLQRFSEGHAGGRADRLAAHHLLRVTEEEKVPNPCSCGWATCKPRPLARWGWAPA